MYIYVKGCLENDVKDAWEMREEKRLVRGVGGLRSKVDGEVPKMFFVGKCYNDI